MGQGAAKSEDGGLSPKEKRLIRDSWNAFTNAHKDYGVILFTSFFLRHPDYQQLFSNFRNKPLRTLADNPRFRAHACTVGYQITSMVEALDSPEKLQEILRKNAEFHSQQRGVQAEQFVQLGQVVVSVLSANVEFLMSEPTIKAWEKLFKLMDDQNRATFLESSLHKSSYKLDSTSVLDTSAAAGSAHPGAKHKGDRRKSSAANPRSPKNDAERRKSTVSNYSGGSETDPKAFEGSSGLDVDSAVDAKGTHHAPDHASPASPKSPPPPGAKTKSPPEGASKHN